MNSMPGMGQARPTAISSLHNWFPCDVLLQVEVAKLIMLGEAGLAKEELPLSRRSRRRETWCPGRSVWGPPLIMVPGGCGRCGVRVDYHTLLQICRPIAVPFARR